MTITQITALFYMVISLVGVIAGTVLLARVVRVYNRRKALQQNGTLRLIILKRGVRYTLISLALLILAAVGVDVLFTEAPRPEAGLMLVVQPLILTGYMVFDYISEGWVERSIRKYQTSLPPTPGGYDV